MLVIFGTGNFATVGGQGDQIVDQIRQVKTPGLGNCQQKLGVQRIHPASKESTGGCFERIVTGS